MKNNKYDISKSNINVVEKGQTDTPNTHIHAGLVQTLPLNVAGSKYIYGAKQTFLLSEMMRYQARKEIGCVFDSFYDFYIPFRNCSDSVICFVFHCIYMNFLQQANKAISFVC